MKLPKFSTRKKLRATAAHPGIIAFNAMKTWQAPIVPTSAPITKTPVADVGSTIKPAAVSSRPPLAQKDSVQAKPIAKDAGRVKQTGNAKSVDSGKVYVVVKGDSPVTIAKKFKVSYDDLVVLNHIDDPRKLQIGQKLLIPKTPRTKKADE